jgi:hypothetical protein
MRDLHRQPTARSRPLWTKYWVELLVGAVSFILGLTAGSWIWGAD